MNMTKRDIADIVLVWMAVSFILALLTSIVTLGSIIGMPEEQTKWMTRSVAVAFQIAHLLVLLFLNYLLLFKRPLILDLVFPDGNQKEVDVPVGLAVLTSYAFWIRLLGIFTFLGSGTGFLGHLVTDLAAKRQFASGAFWMMQSGSQLVSALLPTRRST
jgi:hypothetical protein